MKAFIKRAFPVPRVLIPARLAVDISDGRLRYFGFDRKHGNLVPREFGQTDFPRIRLRPDEKGMGEAKGALAKFAAEHDDSAVRVVVHEAEAYVFRTSVKTTDPREVRSAIESSLEENVPIPLSDAIFEYTAVRMDEKRGETIVAVSVVSERTLVAAVDLFRSAGMTPVSFETESRALSRSLFKEGDVKAHAVLAIDAHHSTVFIVQDGAVSFSSSIEVGSYDIDSAVAKTFDLAPDAARELIRTKAFSHERDDMKVFDAMIPALSTLRDELDKVLAYWKTLDRKEPEIEAVTDIVLAGSYSLISGLAQYVSITTKLPVVQGSVWTRVGVSPDDVPDLPYRESLDYGAVIGSLL